jgi:hypothetical protein
MTESMVNFCHWLIRAMKAGASVRVVTLEQALGPLT